MAEPNKYVTMEWVRDVIVVLTVVGGVFGAYLNLNNRVVAAEDSVVYMKSALDDYKNVPQSLARIEEQVSFIRKDIERIEKTRQK